jgi:hypothetical protein
MCGVGANKDQVNGWFYLVAAIGVYSYATFWLLILVRPPKPAPPGFSL